MTGATHSQGAFSKLLIEPGASTHTFDGSSEIYEFLSENIQEYERIVGGSEVTGSRAHRFERTRIGSSVVRGSILKWISPGELANLLVHMHGATTSPTETLPYFGLLFDRDEGVFGYNDCKVTRWVMRGRAAEEGEEGPVDLITLQLDILGSKEVGPNDSSPYSWPVSPPSLGTSVAFAPYVFSDSNSAVTIEGAARPISEFVILCDHRCYARTVNNRYPHSIMARDRIMRARFRVPWNSSLSALFATDLAGAAASIVLTGSGGAVSTTFTIDKLQIPRRAPVVDRGREEVSLILDGMITDSGSNSNELAFTNDSTP